MPVAPPALRDEGGDKHDAKIYVSCTAQEKRVWQRAFRWGELSDIVRRLLNEAARQRMEPKKGSNAQA